MKKVVLNGEVVSLLRLLIEREIKKRKLFCGLIKKVDLILGWSLNEVLLYYMYNGRGVRYFATIFT